MQPTLTAMLARAEIFDGLTQTQYELVAYICEPQSLRKGHVVARENERSNDLYVIGRGGVEVLVDPALVDDSVSGSDLTPVVLTELGEGLVVGEIALVDQGLRSATIRVSQNDTLLLRIQRDRLMLLCDTYPELGYTIMKNLAAELALKIRRTSLTFREYQLLLAQSGE